jgi:ribosomal protein S27E
MMMQTQNACIAKGYSLMITKVMTGYDVSCEGSGHIQIVFTPKLSSSYVICEVTK